MHNDTTDRRNAIDKVAEAFRDAYVEHAGDTGALLHARAVAGSAIADILAEQAKHETTVRMRIDLAELEADAIDAIAQKLKMWPYQVRDVLDAVLERQGAGAVRLLPAQAPRETHSQRDITTLQLIPPPAAITARQLIDVDDDDARIIEQLADDTRLPLHEVQRVVDAILERRAIDATAPPAPVRDLEGCTFCDIAHRGATAEIVYEWPDALAIVPINPVTDGHLLVIPRTHAEDFIENPIVTANVARRAAQLAQIRDPALAWNVITSAGVDATQSVFHLHAHLVPRYAEDGLALPWSPAPVPVTATKCASCGMRIGYVNYRGHVLGWGCANANTDDTLALARDLGIALTDLAVRAIDADGTEGGAGDDLVGQFLEGVTAHPRVPDNALPALHAIVGALGPAIAGILEARADQ